MQRNQIPVANRAANIEYAIRDVVVPATELESQGYKILKLNIGDPIAYPGLPTPKHMVDAYANAIKNGRNGYSLPMVCQNLEQQLLKMNGEKAGMLVKMIFTSAMESLKLCK